MREILFVDDEKHILSALRRELRGRGWCVTTSSDPLEARDWIERRSFDIVVSDFRMPGMNGVDLLTRVNELWPGTVRIILSGYTDAGALLNAVNEAGLFRYLLKPWDSEALTATLEAAWRERKKTRRDAQIVAEADRRSDEALRRQEELQRLEMQEPGLTSVEFSPDGTIVLLDE